MNEADFPHFYDQPQFGPSLRALEIQRRYYQEPQRGSLYYMALGAVVGVGAIASIFAFQRAYDAFSEIPSIHLNLGESNPLWGTLYDDQPKDYRVRDLYLGTAIPVVELDSDGRHRVGYLAPGTVFQSQGMARGPVYDAPLSEREVAQVEDRGQPFGGWVQIGDKVILIDRFGKLEAPDPKNKPKFMRRVDLEEVSTAQAKSSK